MVALDIKYKTILDNIMSTVQLSEELKTYLDTEEDDDYKALVTKYEGSIHELYTQVADESPLQLVAFEKYLLNDQFEGLYLPKALGYAVLRGRVNAQVKYHRPQDHFAEILTYIINSSNFEQVKLRVGQSIQIGFALSSDIWITNLISSVTNKRVKTFLESQKSMNFREVKLRNTALVKYRKQFQSLNFATAKFPNTTSELLVEAGTLKDFLIFRGLSQHSNDQILSQLNEFLANPEFRESEDFYELCLISGLFFDLDQTGELSLKTALTAIRNNQPKDSDKAFVLLNQLSERVGGLSIDSEKRLSKVITKDSPDKVSNYFTMQDKVLTHGYVSQEASSAIRDYYYQNEGLSEENEAVRKSILSKLGVFITNLPVTEYQEYFEINKVFAEYMDIFSNQKFNQDLKTFSLSYVKKCLKFYKDKRSREYQDIKKFVKSTFLDYGFMTDKQLVELFKTKRKPKAA